MRIMEKLNCCTANAECERDPSVHSYDISQLESAQCNVTSSCPFQEPLEDVKLEKLSPKKPLPRDHEENEIGVENVS